MAVCDMALPGRGMCQMRASNGGRRVAKCGECGFRLESSEGVANESLRHDMRRHGEVHGYGWYEESWLRGMALVQDESKSKSGGWWIWEEWAM